MCNNRKEVVGAPTKQENPSLKPERKMESLRRDIKGCKNVIKQKDENKNNLKKIITNKNADLAEIKKKLQNTLEYIEDKLKT